MISTLIRWAGQAALRLRYRVRVQGLEALEGEGGFLFLPNHPALVDPLIVTSVLHRRFQPAILADQDQVARPVLGWIARRMGVRPMPDVVRHGEAALPAVAEALAACRADLAAGRSLLLYPAGRLARSWKEDLGASSAVAQLLKEVPQARVVLVRTRGLWGSRFSWADGRQPDFLRGLWRSLGMILANALVFTPRREVVVDLVEVNGLPTERLALNRHLEHLYHQGATPRLHVPAFWWQGARPTVLPEPESARREARPADVPMALRQEVLEELSRMSGRTDLADGQELARDLGLDSLGIMELQLWIQEVHRQTVPVEALQMVGDVLRAAAGQPLGNLRPVLAPVPLAWTVQGELRPRVPVAGTLLEAFFRQAYLGFDRPAVADQASGVRTYRELGVAMEALRPSIEAMPGTHVGILLPASVAATVAVLAVLSAGKVPVMLNWTVGPRALRHAVDLLDVQQVLTSRALVGRLQAQGVVLGEVTDRFCLLEELAGALGPLDRLGAWLRARMGWRRLAVRELPETAVVLFTSGSERLPKAVPLTHANILANLRAVQDILPFGCGDRMMGILPPFHSLGLVGTHLFPLLAGIPVVHAPNPTDGPGLAAHVEAYRTTVILGTPTFLQGLLRAGDDAQLASLAWGIVGAEACPEGLYAQLARRLPGLTLLEGYGITECSPVVAVNRAGDPRPGTLGPVIQGLEHAVVSVEGGERVPSGATGLLLVRGPSVFGGYLKAEGPGPFRSFEGREWYVTGDLVKEVEGCLVFQGRLSRFVKLGGEMVSLPAMEAALQAAFAPEGEASVAVVARGTEARPELVLCTTLPLERPQVQEALRMAGLSSLHRVDAVVQLEALPVLGSGKTDLRALAGLVASTLPAGEAVSCA